MHTWIDKKLTLRTSTINLNEKVSDKKMRRKDLVLFKVEHIQDSWISQELYLIKAELCSHSKIFPVFWDHIDLQDLFKEGNDMMKMKENLWLKEQDWILVNTV